MSSSLWLKKPQGEHGLLGAEAKSATAAACTYLPHPSCVLVRILASLGSGQLRSVSPPAGRRDGAIPLSDAEPAVALAAPVADSEAPAVAASPDAEPDALPAALDCVTSSMRVPVSQ